MGIEEFKKNIDTTYTHETNKLDDVKERILEVKKLLNEENGDKEVLSKELKMLIDEQEKLESKS